MGRDATYGYEEMYIFQNSCPYSVIFYLLNMKVCISSQQFFQGEKITLHCKKYLDMIENYPQKNKVKMENLAPIKTDT